MNRFADKVALVTGAASGIGAVMAESLVAEGASVVLFDLNPAGLAAAAEKLGPRALAVTGDVTIDDDVAAAVAAAVETFGGLHAAFNVAGAVRIGNIVDIDPLDWQFTVDVVLKGTFLTTRHAARAIEKTGTGGSIVNVSSLNAHVPLIGGSAYASAKAAVESFTKCSALEFAAAGIRVNAVLPGLVDTPMTRDLLAIDAVAQDYYKRIPARRAADPAEIADSCLYLASDQATYVNGTSLVVDGGWEITNYPDLSSLT